MSLQIFGPFLVTTNHLVYLVSPREKTRIDELKIYHVISLKGEKYCFSSTPSSNAEY